jgi:hypothetical protein
MPDNAVMTEKPRADLRRPTADLSRKARNLSRARGFATGC